MNEKLNPNEDATLKSGMMRGSSRSPPPRKELRMQRSFVQRGSAQLTKFSNSVAARDASHFAIANPRWFEDRYNNKKGKQNDGDASERLLVKPKDSTKDKQSTGKKNMSTITLCFALFWSETLCGLMACFYLPCVRVTVKKTGRMNISGPLVSAGGKNMKDRFS